jgi:hypothetical protein
VTAAAAMAISREQQTILTELLTSESHHLQHVIRESNALSEPCPPGSWRWGKDPTPGEAAEYRARSARCQARLADVRDMLAELGALDVVLTAKENSHG